METTLRLLPQDGANGGEETKILRVKASFGTGLGQFKVVTTFQSALDNSAEDFLLRMHVTVLLAQCMWATGTEESQDSAKTLLLEK